MAGKRSTSTEAIGDKFSIGGSNTDAVQTVIPIDYQNIQQTRFHI